MAEISEFVSTFNYPPYLILVMHCFDKYYSFTIVSLWYA